MIINFCQSFSEVTDENSSPTEEGKKELINIVDVSRVTPKKDKDMEIIQKLSTFHLKTVSFGIYILLFWGKCINISSELKR